MAAEALPPGSHAGATVGPYRFVRKIGSGGMGEVWLGRDERLSREVAMKVVRPDLFENATVRERFLREAEHASSVIHPYVATVFDVIERSGETILVMEYVEGRPLNDVVDEDEPPFEERLRLATEVAEALDAIHDQGILHRDLKPGNILVTRAGHVKVLDFGLARRPKPQPDPSASPDLTETAGMSITGPGVAVGSVAYMSPEQLRGSELDTRSDVFSLGIVLTELVTSHHPFLRDSLSQTVSAILEADPFDPESGSASLAPASVRPILARSLSKSPENRYETAGEVAEDLREVLRGGTARAVRLAARRRRRRATVTAGAVVVVVASCAAGVAAWLRTPPAVAGSRVAVAFVPLEDRTGREDGAIRATMIADLIATDLASSRIVRPIGPEQIRTILAGLGPDASTAEVARRLASALSVDYVAHGVLYSEGDRLVATLETSPTRGGPPVAKLRADGPTATAIAETLAGRVRRALPGVSVLTALRDDRADLETLISKSEEARLLFERGATAWRDGRLGTAMDLLEKAIAIDPGFALARATLAQVEHAAGYGREARDEAERARKQAPGGSSPAAERLRWTLDAVRAEVFEDSTAFAEAAGRLAALYADEPETLDLYAKALDAAERRSEALSVADRAIALDHARPSLHMTRGEILAHAERWDAALEAIDEGGRLYEALGSREGSANAERLRGRTLFQAQRHAAAAETLARSVTDLHALGQDALAADAERDLAGVYLMTGQPGKAESHLAAAAPVARASGNLGLACRIAAAQGAQAYVQGDYAKAEAFLRDAIDQARRLANDDLLLDPLSNLTSLLMFVGRYDDARASEQELLDAAGRSGLGERIADAKLNMAILDLLQGRLDDSERAFGEILSGEGDGAVSQNAAWARSGRAEVLQARGRLAPALEDANAAVATFDKLGAPGFAGYARLRRGLIAAELGRVEEAEADFDAAHTAALQDEAGLVDLAARVDIGRLLLAANEQRKGEIRRRPERQTEAAAAQSPALQARLDATRCRAWLLSGEASRAEAACRVATANPAAQAVDAIAARAHRAQALAALRRYPEAREAAQEAFGHATDIGLPLPAARAASVLASLPAADRPEDAVAIRERGRAYLEAYLSGVPAPDRERVRRRADVARLEEVLGTSAEDPKPTATSPGESGGRGASSWAPRSSYGRTGALWPGRWTRETVTYRRSPAARRSSRGRSAAISSEARSTRSPS